MSDHTEYEETELPFTEKDESDLQALLDSNQPVQYHSVLKVWQELLRNAPAEAAQKVTPSWAMRITGKFPFVKFSEMNDYRDIYFNKIAQLSALLDEVISNNPDSLKVHSAEEDMAENSDRYKSLLLEWQKIILSWELDWDCAEPNAHLEVPAISEVHKMFFAQDGITAFLDQVGFEFTEEDRDALQAELAKLKEDQ